MTLVADPTAPAPEQSRSRRPLVLHLAALALVLLALVPVLGTGASFSADEGAAIVQARSLSRGDGWIVEHPAPAVDPAGVHYPLENSDQGTRGAAPYAKHPLYPALLAVADRVGGVTAMVLLSLAGTVAAAGLAALLARALDPALARPTLWVVGLASPLFFDGFLVIGHTLGAALAAGAVLLALRALDRRTVPAALAVAPAVAAGVLLRTEFLLFAIALAAAVLVVGLVARRPAFAVLTSAVTVVAAGAARMGERAWTARIIGPSVRGAVSASLPGGGVPGRVRGFVLTWLTPGYGGSNPVDLALLAMLGAVVLAACVLRRRPHDEAAVIVLSVAGIAAAALALMAGPSNVVPGLLVAFPPAAAGLVLVRRGTVATAGARLGLGVAALFSLAVVATQYQRGGSGEWGGRYFALALPVAVPILLLALRDGSRHLAPRARRVAGVSLLGCMVAMSVMAVGSLRAAHGRNEGNERCRGPGGGVDAGRRRGRGRRGRGRRHPGPPGLADLRPGPMAVGRRGRGRPRGPAPGRRHPAVRRREPGPRRLRPGIGHHDRLPSGRGRRRRGLARARGACRVRTAVDIRPPAAQDGRVRRLWQAPLWAHVAALGVLLVLLFPLMRPASSFTSDEGAYALQVKALEHGSWAYDYRAAPLDPQGRAFPVILSDGGPSGYYPYVRHPAYPLLLDAATRLVGWTVGLHLVNLLGVLGAAAAAWLLAGELDARLRRPAFWLMAGGPVLVNGFIIWAHAPSAALGGFALVGAARVARRGITPALAVGTAAAVVGSVLLRSEGLLLAVALAIVLAAVRLERTRRPGPGVAAFGLVAGPAAIAALAERRWILVDHRRFVPGRGRPGRHGVVVPRRATERGVARAAPGPLHRQVGRPPGPRRPRRRRRARVRRPAHVGPPLPADLDLGRRRRLGPAPPALRGPSPRSGHRAVAGLAAWPCSASCCSVGGGRDRWRGCSAAPSPSSPPPSWPRSTRRAAAWSGAAGTFRRRGFHWPCSPPPAWSTRWTPSPGPTGAGSSPC